MTVAESAVAVAVYENRNHVNNGVYPVIINFYGSNYGSIQQLVEASSYHSLCSKGEVILYSRDDVMFSVAAKDATLIEALEEELMIDFGRREDALKKINELKQPKKVRELL